MSSEIEVIPGAISEILASVSETGLLTLADRYGLMAAAFDDSLDEEERRAINRVLRAVQRGKVKVAQDLSNLG
ncbi:MAG: hypothetical protein ACOC0N_01215 [Chroococcales cyanobacterium]